MADWMSTKKLPTTRLEAAADVLDGLEHLHSNK